jgi:hypothetical protein
MYLYRKHTTSLSYRMGAADIRELIDADDFLVCRPDLTPEENETCSSKRRRSLGSLLYL